MNELSIIFSAISIILSGISTVVAIIAISQTGKIDKSNKKMRFFINTFDEFLIQKIPRAVSYIRYEYDTSDTTRFRIRDYQESCNVLISLENDSAFLILWMKNFMMS